ncbi:MAG: hypothetical protein GC171_15340 [Terrimonas sp.]|nr:hypothetical protein [Terrimonas sp.]
MNTKFSLGAILLLTVIIFSCQKELSYETNAAPSDGSLQADGTGICLGNTVNGTYKADTALLSSNYVDVAVNVIVPGSYTIYTDTINGYSFKATGNFTAAGITTVRLQGAGKPIAQGVNTFTVNYDSTQCFFSVTVTGSGGGGGGTASFTLDATAGNCNNPVLQGTYMQGTAHNGTNTVTLSVNVTTVGTYSLTTTTSNAVAFSAMGSFTTTGVQTLVLTGGGIPAAGGTFSYSITAGATTCAFDVQFTPVSVASDYFPRTTNSNWSYEYNDAASDSTFIRVIPQTLTVSGNPYNIFMMTGDVTAGYDTSGYYRKSGNDYFQWIDMGDFWGLDDPLWAEYIFLKDNQPAGFTWNTTGYTGNFTDNMGNTFPVTVRMKYTILQKDVSHSVTTSTGTVNYPNTIEVEEAYEQFNGTTWVDLGAGTARYYYSRNIGMVDLQYLDAGGAVTDKFEMRRYQVF